MLKFYWKIDFVEKVWPANFVLFIYVFTHYVETVKWFDFNRYIQLSQWSRGNASDCDASGTGFDSQLWLGVLCF